MIYDPITAAKVSETAKNITMTLLKKRELNLAYGGFGGKSVYYQNYFESFLKKQYNKKHWPYQYEVGINVETQEVERWCWERFKGRYWHSNRQQFVFKREKDAVLFALRWM